MIIFFFALFPDFKRKIDHFEVHPFILTINITINNVSKSSANLELHSLLQLNKIFILHNFAGWMFRKGKKSAKTYYCNAVT